MSQHAFVHESNKGILRDILELRDRAGKHVIQPIQADILALIGRFDRDLGNFMGSKAMRDALPGKKVQTRTISEHMKYLRAIGAVSESFEERGGKQQLVRRLRPPEAGPRPTLAEFRTTTGMSQYRYRKSDGDPDKYLSFLPERCEIRTPPTAPEGVDFCHVRVRNSHSVCAKFAPLIESKDMREKKEKRKTPYSPPESATGAEEDAASRRMTTAPSGRPSCSGQSPSEKEDLLSFLDEEEEKPQESEMILKPKKKKREPKTARERQAKARQMRANGHVANPLGPPKRASRMLNPKRARTITDTGAVTIPQLWAAYIEIFGEAFGLPDELPLIMPGTRDNVSRFFDDMRDKFLRATGYTPDNRELYEYLKWFHEADRLRGLMSRKKSGDPGYVHPKQVAGMVHLKRFHDQVLSRKKRDAAPSVSAASTERRRMTDFVRDAYERIRESEGNDLKLAYCIATYGYVIFAEWMHDYKGASPSACKTRIVDLFSRFIARSANKQAARGLLGKAPGATEKNEGLFQSSVWHDWQEACSDIIDLAEQKAMEHADGE
jgi:hypothetical protein